LDTATRKVVAWRKFDAVVPSASEDTYGGESGGAECAEGGQSSRAQ